MKRRVIAAVASVLLAGVGALFLVSYVSGADQRAMAGVQTQTVLMVDAPIAEGTPAEELTELVTTSELPAKAVATGSLSSLDPVAGMVVTTDLQPGEQLLQSRFADPEDFAGSQAVEVPEGLHQVTVSLENQRVLGGYLAPGDTVGVFVSATDPAETHLVLHKVLVTKVQGGITVPAEGEQGEPAGDPAAAPTGGVMVTLAVDAPDAEKVAWGMEHGTLWLSLEPEDAPENGTRIVTRENVYE